MAVESELIKDGIMCDIQQALERLGVWVANNREDVTWMTVAAGFKGQNPSKITSLSTAMMICGCMAQLNKNNSNLHDLLFDYYVMGMTFMSLARKHGCLDNLSSG